MILVFHGKSTKKGLNSFAFFLVKSFYDKLCLSIFIENYYAQKLEKGFLSTKKVKSEYEKKHLIGLKYSC